MITPRLVVALAALLGPLALAQPDPCWPAGAAEARLTETDPFELPWAARAPFAAELAPSSCAALEQLSGAPVYHLELTLSDDWRSLAGEAEIRYTNTTPDALEELVLRLNPNALGSVMTVSELTVAGWAMPWTLEQQDTALRVTLPWTLKPGAALTLRLAYELAIGSDPRLGYGRFGRYPDVVSLPDAYPVLSVYRDGAWLEAYPVSQGDPLVAEAGFYLARLTLAADQELVASGRVLSREVEGARQRVTVAAGPVRDLYLAVSRGYEQRSLAAGEVVLHSYAPARLGPQAEAGLELAAAALKFFSAQFAPYPYRELEFVPVPVVAGGIEYPGVINLANGIYRDDETFATVVVHEVAHQWAFNLVGNDQLREPWLDEALAQYLTLRYLEASGPSARALGYLNHWRGLWNAAPDREQPIGLPVAAYQGGAYSGIVYGKGLFFFRELERALGREAMDELLRAYFGGYAWQLVGREDLEALAEKTCGCQLGPLFERWVGAP